MVHGNVGTTQFKFASLIFHDLPNPETKSCVHIYISRIFPLGYTPSIYAYIYIFSHRVAHPPSSCVYAYWYIRLYLFPFHLPSLSLYLYPSLDPSFVRMLVRSFFTCWLTSPLYLSFHISPLSLSPLTRILSKYIYIYIKQV